MINIIFIKKIKGEGNIRENIVIEKEIDRERGESKQIVFYFLRING